jgi:hypothetical protein
MARKNWMPRGIPARAKLLAHLDATLPLYKDDLNISKTTLDRVHAIHLMFDFMYQNGKKITSFLKAWNSYFNSLNEGKDGIPLGTLPKLSDFGIEPVTVGSNVFGFIRGLRKILMKHVNYSESVGLALMFYGAERNFKKNEYKPTIKIIVTGNVIKIVTSVIDVKSHRIKLKIGKSKVYVDGEIFSGASLEFKIPVNTKNMGIPVSIKLKGIIKNVEFGNESDIVEILYKS